MSDPLGGPNLWSLFEDGTNTCPYTKGPDTDAIQDMTSKVYRAPRAPVQIQKSENAMFVVRQLQESSSKILCSDVPAISLLLFDARPQDRAVS